MREIFYSLQKTAARASHIDTVTNNNVRAAPADATTREISMRIAEPGE